MTTTTTSTSTKDDGNQPTSTTEGGGDGCQPVAMTILLYFSSFVLLTVYLLAHSHPTVHTMPSIMRATAPCVQSLPTPSAYAHCKHCFLSPFFRLLTIYFPMCYSLTDMFTGLFGLFAVLLPCMRALCVSTLRVPNRASPSARG